MSEDEVAIARKYAEAYAAFDRDVLRAVLAPDLRFRQVNPGGYLTLTGAEAYLDATADFLQGFASHEPGGARAEPIGDRIATASRLLLHAGAQAYVMEHQEFVTVAGGRITAIDSVCTGARPA